MLEVRGYLPQMGKPGPQKYYYTKYYNTKILLHENFQVYGSTQVQLVRENFKFSVEIFCHINSNRLHARTSRDA